MPIKLSRSSILHQRGACREGGKMKRIGLLLLIMVLWLGGAAQAARKYELILLDAPGDYAQTYANAINNRGEIVGFSQDIHGYLRATYWDPAKNFAPMDIGTLPGCDMSEARGINDSGDVVGVAYLKSGGGKRPFSWSKTQGIAPLQSLPGSTYDEIYSIANNGKASGVSAGAASIFERDQPAVNISAGFTFTTRGSTVSSMVVGLENSPRTNGVWKAVVGNGNFEEIFALTPGTTSSTPMAISNDGVVVGNYDVGFYTYEAFIWDGDLHHIGTLGGTFGCALAINGKKQVVGSSYTASGLTSAFFYEFETMTISDLNNLEVIGKPHGYRFKEAHGINHRGEIVGWGEPSLAFLLRPQVLDVINFIMLLLLD
jgi:probable HAF family extracellular repeat protein